MMVGVIDCINESGRLYNTCAPGNTGTPLPVAGAGTLGAHNQIGLTTTEYKSVCDKLRKNYASNRTQGMLGILLNIE